MPETQQQKDTLRLALLEQLQGLITAALSLVAALAWNDAIQSFFKQLFGDAGSLSAKFFYALFITFIVIVFSRRVTKMIQALRKRLKLD
jgi:hypothetical protein